MIALKYIGDDIYRLWRIDRGRKGGVGDASALFDVKLQLRLETELAPARRLLSIVLEIEFRKCQCCGASRE